jgi:hypothetical protein
MAEAAGLVLGSVSLIALFTTAVDGYRLISAARNDLPKEAHFVVTKLEIEKQRYRVWGQFMGFSDEAGCEEFSHHSKPTQHLCIAILTEVASIIRDTKTLAEKYGLVELGVGSMKDEQLKVEDIKSRDEADPSQSAIVERVNEIVKAKVEKTGKLKKWKWAIDDGQKFERLVDKLCYLNDSLANCLTPFNVRQLAKALPSFVIPTIDDLPTLSKLGKSFAGDETVLTTSADLKRLHIEAQAAEGSDSTASVKAPIVPWPALQTFEDKGSRSMAYYTDASSQKTSPEKSPRVMIEWREIGRKVQDEDRTLVQNRVQALALLLFTRKSSDFRILSCRGIVKDPSVESGGVLRYGFVFDLPSTDTDPEAFPITLFDLLDAKIGPIPALGERFDLAKTLASALALFHASKWLHKGLKSDNILFFRLNNQPTKSPTAITSPYIAGFDVARPDGPTDQSGPLSRTLDSDDNLYRHPDVRGPLKKRRYRKDHDIYSLGVLLYEIGFWSSVEKRIKPIVPPKSAPGEFREKLIESCGELEWTMGKKYKEVVVRCLEGDFGITSEGDKNDDGGKLLRVFWSKVIRELEQCHA